MKVLRRFLLVLIFIGTTSAWAGTRNALIVGNSDYLSVAKLYNPENDALLIKSHLDNLGFTTHLSINAKEQTMSSLVSRSIANANTNEDLFFLFFSGHAVQIDGRNYLLSTDVDFSADGANAKGFVSVEAILGQLANSGIEKVVVVLDACRDDPFDGNFPSLQKGLARIGASQFQSVIAFATEAGGVAFDGKTSNSPFSIALSNALSHKNPKIPDLFFSVRSAVRRATNNLQTPWISISLDESIHLFEDQDTDASSPLQLNHYSINTQSNSELSDILESVWARTLVGSKLRSEYEFYAEHFPDGVNIDYVEKVLSSDQTLTDKDYSEILFPEFTSNKLAEGVLGVERTKCDVLASDPLDPRKFATGVHSDILNVSLSIRTCIESALRSRNSHPRQVFLLARSLDASKRYIEAAALYLRAAELGYESASVNLAYLILNGLGIEKNATAAFELYKQAALLGNPRARAVLGWMHIQGEGVAVDFAEGLSWLELAADTGWPQAHNILGDIYRRGTIGNPNYKIARDHYALAANYPSALTNLGRMSELGQGGKKNIQHAKNYYDRAISLGDKWAPWRLARMISNHDIDGDDADVVSLLKLAVDRGTNDALVDLGLAYRDGKGVTQDKSEGRRLNTKAFELGVRNAEKYLD